MTSLARPVTRRTPLGHAVDLMWVLVSRNVKLRYRGSVLGVVWSQLGPLSVIAVMAFVFRRIVRLDIAHYPVFVFVGVLSWTWFQNSLLASTDAVLSGRDLVRRPGFPAAVLPAAEVATQFVYFVLSLPVLLAAMVVTGVQLRPTLLGLPFVMAVQFLLSLGPGYLLAALQVRFRDVGHLVAAVLLPLFYATPVFYSTASVGPHYRIVYRLNPMATVIDSYRSLVLYGRWGPVGALGLVALVGAAVTVAGVVFYLAAVPRFAEET